MSFGVFVPVTFNFLKFARDEIIKMVARAEKFVKHNLKLSELERTFGSLVSCPGILDVSYATSTFRTQGAYILDFLWFNISARCRPTLSDYDL